MTIYPPDVECFASLLAELDRATKSSELVGPRVLSDRQYSDSNVLSYRYGGFRPLREVQVDGTYKNVIFSPGGDRVADERYPWFHLPSWVEDPFPTAQIAVDTDGTTLGSRYRVEQVIRFSNSGGIYVAVDREFSSKVAIKEARPYTHNWSDLDVDRDAVDLLKREYAVLDRLSGVSAVPKPMSLFSEGGHTFLVEEFAEGLTFHEYFASADVIVAPYLRDRGRVLAWSRAFFRTASALLDAVDAVHERGVVIGDLSAHNIIVSPDGWQVKLVDFESAVIGDDDPAVLMYAAKWGIAGFYNPARPLAERLTTTGDLRALGLVLISALIPVNPLAKLNPDSPTEFLAAFLRAGIPVEVGHLIDALLGGSQADAHVVLEKARSATPHGSRRPQSFSRRPQSSPGEQEPAAPQRVKTSVDGIHRDVARALEETVSFLLRNAHPGNRDRLWDADARLDATNSVNLAYGAYGTILFLRDSIGSTHVPEWMVEWAEKRARQGDELAPGLFIGNAGVAYALLEVGRLDAAKSLMATVPQSPLAFADPGMLYGVAGWGHASLYFWKRTGDGNWLDQASRAGEHLLRVGNTDSSHWWWDTPNELLSYGFGRGASGIALFLAQLFAATGRADFRRAAVGALDFDVSRRTETPMGWQWGRYEGDRYIRPYWIEGSAGIGAVAARFPELVSEDRVEVARRIAKDSFATFSANPNLFQGLAGIGEFMIDMARAASEEAYLADAREIAQSILLFGLKQPEGMAWPGRDRDRIACDMATGAAGIGFYFERLLRLGPRRFMDLPHAAENWPVQERRPAPPTRL